MDTRLCRLWVVVLLPVGAWAQAPTIIKVFGQSPIETGQTSRLRFFINGGPLGNSNISFTDTLPAGLVVATPNGLSGGCGGGAITAVAGSNSIGLTGATLPIDATCTFSVNVLATSPGGFGNTTGNVSGSQGTGNTATANLTVVAAQTPQPPVISKYFTLSDIFAGQSTALSFTIINPNPALALSGIGFSDTLPGGLLVATPNGLSGGCGGGTITATSGTGVVSLTGATLGPGAECKFRVNVLAPSAGSFLNTTTAVGSTEAGSGNAARDLIVVRTSGGSPPPRIAKLFGQSPMLVGQTTPLTFVINGGPFGASNINFSDMLPAGLVVATPSGLSGGCGGGVITAVAGSNSIALAGATLPIDATCTFSVSVLAAEAGHFLNTTSSVRSDSVRTGNTASDDLTVTAARTPQPPVISKFFTLSDIFAGQSTALNFTIINPNPALALSGIGFSDTLPGGLLVATPNGLSGGCGGGTITATAGTGVVSLTGASLGPGDVCTFRVNVIAPTAGSFVNTTTPVTSTEAGTGNAARASIVVRTSGGSPPPSIAKLFGHSLIPVGQTTPLKFIVNGGPFGATSINFSDMLPAGLVLATPSGLSGGCGGGTITAADGSNTITLSGATLPIDATCTFSVNVLATATGHFLNTTSSVRSNSTRTGNTASDALVVVGAAGTPQPPVISKFFAQSDIFTGQSTALTFTILNPNPALALTGVGLSETLPAGVVVATPNGLSGGCGGGAMGGAISAVAGTAVVSLTGATLRPGAVCTFSVNVLAPAAGSFLNTTTAVTSTEAGAGNAARDLLVVRSPVSPPPPSITKSFGQPVILVGQTTTLTFVINGGPFGSSNINFSDTLPAGLVVATPNGLSGGCGGGVITAAAGSNSITLTGATLPIDTACTFSVNVLATAPGQLLNATSSVRSDSIRTGNMAQAVLTAVTLRPPLVSKAFAQPTIVLNASTPMTLMIANPNPVALTAITLTDNLPAGLVVADPPGVVTTCGGGTVVAGGTAGSSVVGVTIPTLAANSICTVTLNITANALGTFSNATGAVSTTETGAGAPSNTATLTAIVPPDAFQVRYAADLNVTDALVNLTNTGANGAPLHGPGFGPVGNICVNVYAFSPDEQMVACCSCLVTPNGLVSLSVREALRANTLTGVTPNSLVIKLINTAAGPTFTGTNCTGSAAQAGSTAYLLAGGMSAWGTSAHVPGAGAVPGAPVPFGIAETPFTISTLSLGELTSINNRCTSIVGNGSGYGVCRGCELGGRGASKQ